MPRCPYAKTSSTELYIGSLSCLSSNNPGNDGSTNFTNYEVSYEKCISGGGKNCPFASMDKLIKCPHCKTYFKVEE